MADYPPCSLGPLGEGLGCTSSQFALGHGHENHWGKPCTRVCIWGGARHVRKEAQI